MNILKKFAIIAGVVVPIALSSAVGIHGEMTPAPANTSFLLGDLTGDGMVDLRDALLLFNNSMMPDVYPVDYTRSMDFTGDRVIDIADAILLFKYSMLPELYPVYDGGEVSPGDSVTYAEYLAMTGEEQMAFINSFSSITDFFEWRAAAKAEYESQNSGGELGNGGNIELGGGN